MPGNARGGKPDGIGRGIGKVDGKGKGKGGSVGMPMPGDASSVPASGRWGLLGRVVATTGFGVVAAVG